MVEDRSTAMNIQIRLATSSDLGALVEIYNQAILAGNCTADTQTFSVDERRGWFEAHTADKYPILVAVQNNQVLGYLSLSAYREGRAAFAQTAEISYYIHFQHQRHGVASKLMQRALVLSPELGITTLIAMLLGSNSGSIGLLEKFGFKQWGKMPGIAKFDKVRLDHLFYGKHL